MQKLLYKQNIQDTGENQRKEKLGSFLTVLKVVTATMACSYRHVVFQSSVPFILILDSAIVKSKQKQLGCVFRIVFTG